MTITDVVAVEFKDFIHFDKRLIDHGIMPAKSHLDLLCMTKV